MIDATDLRRGVTFQFGSNPYQVLEYSHTKLGRGGAMVKVKARNLKTGGIAEKTFGSDARVEEIEAEKRKLKFLYRTSQSFVFVNPQTNQEIEIDKSLIGEQAGFLRKQDEVWVLFWSFGKAQDKDTPLTIELPPNVILEIRQTVPGVRGNSATNVWKQAVTETGIQIKVPLFINVGDKVRVDTRTGEYVERVA